VESQKVPDSYVMPVITADFIQRVNALEQQVLTTAKLQRMLERPALSAIVKSDQVGRLIEDIQHNTSVDAVITPMSAEAGLSGSKKRKPSATDEPVPGFHVNYFDSDPVRAQKICNALTDQFVTENMNSRGEVAKSTTDFLSRQVDDAKRALDEQDAKLAAFKKQYMGQLPGDVDNNVRMLTSLNSQLDATTQTLSRAQQDKAYTESMLAQQTAAWKSSQSTSNNPQTLEQTLTQLQGQLLQLQARYTDDYPEVIKTKADIAEVEKKLKEVNAAAASASATDSSDKASASEPPEIRQLRLQIHQYQSVIEQAALDQKRLQSGINLYQSHMAMSPNVEEQYKLLTRDNDNALAFYKDLLAKKNFAGVGTSMENAAEGEQMHGGTASLPDSPSFPNRPIFAAGGLGVGLALGLLIAIWLEFSDTSIRTEKDAAAIMDLPLLISVPWLGEDEDNATASGNGIARRRFWGRSDSAPPKEHEHVGV
jgi:uncharacterized protein involved in exopolysaccharide biosynthesis